MTEIEIANLALAKLHYNETLTSSDGTVANATSTGQATEMVQSFFPRARRQIFRMAAWTCIQKRKMLATQEREAGQAYAEGDLVVGTHTTITSVYKCTVAGTSGSSAVTWPTSATVVDGGVTWTYQYDLTGDIPEENYTGYEYAAPLPSDYINRVKVISEDGLEIPAEIEGGVLYTDELEPVLIYIPDETDCEKWDDLLIETIATQLASFLAYPVTGTHENEVALAQAAAMMISQAVAQTTREKRHGQPVPEPWMEGLFEYPPSMRRVYD